MKIFCIGRNYADHAKELNNAVPSQPLIFMKPPTALVRNGRDVYYPEFTKNMHYEAEIVLKICKNGRHVEEKFAHKYFDAISIGIDLTARDVQSECKAKGHPWEIAKAFDDSAPIGEFIELSEVNLEAINFHLTQNEVTVQKGNTKDLIFPFTTLISYISKFFRLQKGDLIFTGTPAGVGPTKIGDKFEGFIEGKKLLECYVK
jgi:2-keto-4-pentenoate hydratase/2-oxohepta-3-ene-1,7-dioic acid hydratase in catechol pathway